MIVDGKKPNWPCYNCIGLVMCVSKEHYDIVQICDQLVDYTVDFYNDAIQHFERIVVRVDPLNKRFEFQLSHEKRGIVIGDPDISTYGGQRRIIVNPATAIKTSGIKLA